MFSTKSNIVSKQISALKGIINHDLLILLFNASNIMYFIFMMFIFHLYVGCKNKPTQFKKYSKIAYNLAITVSSLSSLILFLMVYFRFFHSKYIYFEKSHLIYFGIGLMIYNLVASILYMVSYKKEKLEKLGFKIPLFGVSVMTLSIFPVYVLTGGAFLSVFIMGSNGRRSVAPRFTSSKN